MRQAETSGDADGDALNSTGMLARAKHFGLRPKKCGEPTRGSVWGATIGWILSTATV